MAAKLAQQLKRDSSSLALRRGSELLEACLAHEEYARYLIRLRGYDPNWTDDTYGNSILHYLVYCNHVSMIRFLVEHGANVNSRNFTGATPLHWAAMLGNLEAAELLLRMGSDLSALDVAGSSPLHAAADCGYPELVQLLLRTQAASDVISLRDKNGSTAIELSFSKKTENHKAAYVLLKRFYRTNNIQLPKVSGAPGSNQGNFEYLELSNNNVPARKDTGNETNVPNESKSYPLRSESAVYDVRGSPYYSNMLESLDRSITPNNDESHAKNVTFSAENLGNRDVNGNNNVTIGEGNGDFKSGENILSESFREHFGENSLPQNTSELFFFHRNKERSHNDGPSHNSTADLSLRDKNSQFLNSRRPFFIRSISSPMNDGMHRHSPSHAPVSELDAFPPGPEKVDLMEALEQQLKEEFSQSVRSINYLKSGVKPAPKEDSSKWRLTWQNWIRHVRSEFPPANYTPWLPRSAKHLDIIVSVEHCADCHLHTWSLWHNSEKYCSVADDCLETTLDVVMEARLPVRVFALKVKPEPSRLGALEVTVSIRVNRSEMHLPDEEDGWGMPTSKSTTSINSAKKGHQPKVENINREKEWISHTVYSKLESLSWPSLSQIRKETTEFLLYTLRPIFENQRTSHPDIKSLFFQRAEWMERTTRPKVPDYNLACNDVVFAGDSVFLSGRMLDITKLRKREDVPVDRLEKAMIQHFLVQDGMAILNQKKEEVVVQEPEPLEPPKEVAVVETEKEVDNDTLPEIVQQEESPKPRPARKLSILEVLSSDIVYEDGKNAYDFDGIEN